MSTANTIANWLDLIFLQVQADGVVQNSETYLNFLTPITVTDNPGNQSLDIGVSYSTQSNSASLTDAATLNFQTPLTAIYNAGNKSIDVSAPTPVAYNSVGTFASRPASGTTAGQVYYATDYNPALWDGSAWRPLAGQAGQLFTAPPLSGSWTLVNPGAGSNTTITQQGDYVYFADFLSGGVLNVHSAVTALPGATYTLTATFIPNPIRDSSNHTASAGICVMVTAATGSKLYSFFTAFSANTLNYAIKDQSNSTTNNGSFNAGSNLGAGVGYPITLRIQNTGTSRIFSISGDGINFVALDTQVSTAYSYLTEAFGGICVAPQSGTGAGMLLQSWKLTTP